MTPIYLGYTFTVSPPVPATEILIAELGYAGFESFTETETGVIAYIQKEEAFPNKTLLDFESLLTDIQILKSDEFTITYTAQEIEQVNWNEEWEKNFDPIEVDGRCAVRAPFHKKTDVEFDIVIEPKMSFGTGHHETTHMMIKHLLKLDVTNKKTLDMGCGTGVLAILAEMKGAHPIDAIDIDNWCYLNSIENAERNHCEHITVYEGDVSLLKDKTYDLVIANINRNILLQDIPAYAMTLPTDGILLLSGFYTEDIALITEKCNENGLYFVGNYERNNWVACKFEKRQS
ncbi:ribosomal protein L11 methyltransferase [Dokdonia pacifica]|uniref:Ribosomal protein L11 methyltransferase n=1 Tax=Dokdonia pacifica TaxID=1627892 RepID=A0A239BSX5_9FLAO|nr:50S ribosomal protein L11 methyltransferase [Dokdonia pacifica]GGG27810.1 ribosomal protein L11 methyltransferase [Dokdonia pacifica]SNS10752.1 [LSU ribosomal protein L11P]-lysine N-methyltransferase [Dokdonia pacifica]